MPSIVWPAKSIVTSLAPITTPSPGQFRRSESSLVLCEIVSPHETWVACAGAASNRQASKAARSIRVVMAKVPPWIRIARPADHLRPAHSMQVAAQAAAGSCSFTRSRASATRTTAAKRSSASSGTRKRSVRLSDSYTAPSTSSRSARAWLESSSIGETGAGLAELHRARARPAELDARLLEPHQVLDRLGHRAEAVLQLLDDHAQVGGLARRGDAAVHVDLRDLVGDVLRPGCRRRPARRGAPAPSRGLRAPSPSPAARAAATASSSIWQ